MTRSPARPGPSAVVAVVVAFTLAGAPAGCTGDPCEPTSPEQDGADRRKLRFGEMSPEQLLAAPITFELDVPYTDTGNAQHRLDVYLPREPATDELPVVVYLHGGGWMRGSKSDGARKLLPLVLTGRYAGIAADFRLCDEATWPAQIHDCKAVIRWVRARAADYGFDPDRIGVLGRSSGGHLALLLGTTGDDPALEGDIGPHTGTSSRVHAVANFFGVTDLYALLDRPSTIDRRSPDAPEAKLLGGLLQENRERAAEASPVTYVSPGDAPVLTVHGSDDSVVPHDQAVRLDAALRRAAVPSHFVTIDGGDHGNFGTIADDRVLAFFDRILHGRAVELPVTALPMPPRGSRPYR